LSGRTMTIRLFFLASPVSTQI